MVQTPSLSQLLQHAIETRLLNVHTALVARVERYDAEQQLIDAQPVLRRRLNGEDGSIALEEFPLVPDVPVLFPRAGSYFISFPIQKGDFVQLLFNEESIDSWWAETQAIHGTRHSLEGAVAIAKGVKGSKGDKTGVKVGG